MKVYQAIAKSLIDHGIDTVFGLIGDANLFMADSFQREQGGKFVASSHEVGATLMALGYGALSNTVAVATVTHGPAVVNTLTALIEGVKARTPLVLLCGDTAVGERYDLQNVNQREFIMATGAGFEQLRSPKTVVEDVATAFRRAKVEHRPIALNVPVDFQWMDVEYAPFQYTVPECRMVAPESDGMNDAVGIIASARRPLVLAGRGAIAQSSRSSILRLAKRIDAPLFTSLKGKDLFRGEAFNFGIFGTLSTPEAVDVILSSDCVIAFGASLNEFTTANGTFLEGKRVVQVNAEQAEIGRQVHPDAGVVGDSGLVADLMVRLLDEAEIPASGYTVELGKGEDKAKAASFSQTSHRKPGTLDLRVALRMLDEALPAERVLVTDCGRCIEEVWRSVGVLEPAMFLNTINSAALGLGVSQAIGAAMASGRPTVAITGDGGFMLGGLTEFNTAVRYNCDLVVVVCNDGGYGAEHIQFRNRDMDPTIALMGWPDFASVAKALGGTGFTIRNMDDLRLALRAIQGRSGPMLIDLHIDPDNLSYS
ncbi:thiamine pyrophosphate-binding protein [Mesorhizobium sp.]|uniref:thiamine pyrophosphate-binding protein n=1 Tax=Mesorhizobium sp. TaxID=1871066 RepID=UPI000FE9FD39|nr:thiamine pyrophosphate-binding protein [Mesorhizobium sp.]RWI87917.1 MAG: thiamine pyrophosphate-binding protein [Mesorhizobium sp.]